MQKVGLRNALICAALCSLLDTITGCPSHPPPPCSPALACASIDHLTSGGNCPNIQDDAGFFKGGNIHPSRPINVTYQVVGTATNPPPPSPPTTYTVRNAIQPGTMNEVILGCEMTEPVPGSGKYVQYKYIPVAACFVDDTACASEIPIAPSSAPSVCLTQTQCTGPNCIDYSFNSVPGSSIEAAAKAAAAKAVNDVLTNSNLNNVSLTSLLTVNAFCSNGGHLVTTGNTFQEIGSSCDGVLSARVSPALEVHVRIPSSLAGTYTRIIGSSAAFDFPDQYQAVSLEWLDGNGNSLGFESVAHVLVSPGLIKICGSQHYCIWVHTGPNQK
jgi:hypothetical protein